MTTLSSIENIETARLAGRRIQPDDFALICQMHRDERLMATLGGLRSDEESRDILSAHVDCWQRDGYGPWMWYSKANGRFVGRGG